MSVLSSSDTIMFSAEILPEQPGSKIVEPWKILVIDDESDIHNITRLVLRFFSFKDRPLQILDAYSAKEARALVEQNPDIALILLDVVMEAADSGLRFVQTLREDMNLLLPRIILRTGQPGYAPETDVIRRYDINDYHTKTDLTVSRLVTVITAGLRAYDSLKTVEDMRRDLEFKVAERTKELQTSNALKDQLFAVIAHDLRGPVGNLKAFLDLLSAKDNGDSPEVQGEILEIMRDNANATLNLLDNLLFWARFRQNSLVQDLRTQDLSPVIQDVLSIWAGTARKKAIKLSFEGPEHANSRFDRTTIALVIRNLVGNALKFTLDGGSVTIKINDSDNKWRIQVVDTGVGMDAEQLSRLKHGLFSQSTNGTDNEKGSGLGLMLCSDFIQQHGGQLVIDSQPGFGSSFSFELPKA